MPKPAKAPGVRAGPEIPLDLVPMEAEPVDALPTGREWLYEPKHDGFRCLAFGDGGDVRLQSRSGKPLARYFPEVAAGLAALPAGRFVLDGELVIPGEPFETLQLRLHPAASRIERLAREHPAALVAFDLLCDADGRSRLQEPFESRRTALKAFLAATGDSPVLRLSPATRSAATARRWLGRAGLDGIVAKRLDLPYRPGERAMAKYKLWHTIDCVVGGLYRKRGTGRVDSLLLGLYDAEGRLHYVGRARVDKHAGLGAELGAELEPLIGGPGFTGRAPGGVSRWSQKERKPVPLRPVKVAEVSADHITGAYMRHGARLLRFRDDKAPEACTMDQLPG